MATEEVEHKEISQAAINAQGGSTWSWFRVVGAVGGARGHAYSSGVYLLASSFVCVPSVSDRPFVRSLFLNIPILRFVLVLNLYLLFATGVLGTRATSATAGVSYGPPMKASFVGVTHTLRILSVIFFDSLLILDSILF